jgi:hypothetical protein
LLPTEIEKPLKAAKAGRYDGENKSGSTPLSRAVAIKQAEHEIDRILKSGK